MDTKNEEWEDSKENIRTCYTRECFMYELTLYFIMFQNGQTYFKAIFDYIYFLESSEESEEIMNNRK